MVEHDGMAPSRKQRSLVHAALLLHDLVQSLPAEADVCRSPLRVDQVADLQFAAEQLAAMAADLSIGPVAAWIEDDWIAASLPEPAVIGSRRVHVNAGDGNPQVRQDRMPKFDRGLVVIVAEGEVPQHLETSQMAAVANQFNIARANARLQRAVPAAVGLTEAALMRLHSAANE